MLTTPNGFDIDTLKKETIYMVAELSRRQGGNCAEADLEEFHIILLELLHLDMASGVLTVPSKGDR
jgi:hypothetical protein